MANRILQAGSILLMLMTACAGPRLKVGESAGGEVVDAVGMAPYRADDLPAAKAGALAAAQRSAVERVVGIMVSARTRVKMAVTIDQKILARTAGYIKKYDILRESKVGNFWETRIRALVSFERVESDLKDFGLMDVLEIGNPRVAVLIDESVDGEPVDTTAAGDGLTAILVEGGYTVVERSVQAGAAMQKILAAVEAGDTRAVKDLGSELKVEVVILGEASAEKMAPHPRFKDFISFRARASVKAIRSGTGQILASVSQMASGMEIRPGPAAAKALKGAGELVGEQVKVKMAKVLRARSEIGVTARGVGGMDELQTLQEALRAVNGVEGVQLRAYGNGEAELSMVAGGVPIQDLAVRLEAIRSPRVRVVDTSASEIQVQLGR